ncbi:MAG: helix-turn-helix domain-containing protein [Byssovorax sp.]
MLFAMLRTFERYGSDDLPPLHRLVLITLADLADARGYIHPVVATVAKRTGLSTREVKKILNELHFALWLERAPRQTEKSSTLYVVRLEGGPIVPMRSETSTIQGEAIPNPSVGKSNGVTKASSALRPLNAVSGTLSKAPLSIQSLLAQRPADNLLAVLRRGAETGHTWCASTLTRVLERGGRLTEGERKRLREISSEKVAGGTTSRANRNGVSSLQPMGNWRPKGTS